MRSRWRHQGEWTRKDENEAYRALKETVGPEIAGIVRAAVGRAAGGFCVLKVSYSEAVAFAYDAARRSYVIRESRNDPLYGIAFRRRRQLIAE